MYPSDLTDEQWNVVEDLIPPAKPGGRPREVSMCEVLNAIMYVLRSGCAWRLVAHDFPKWNIVYYCFRQTESPIGSGSSVRYTLGISDF